MLRKKLQRLREWAIKNEHPLLFLVLNSWLLLGFFLCVFVGLAVSPFVLLKVIRVTPAAFSPELKVSLLDLMQAEALSRRAQQLDPRVNLDRYLEPLRSAIGNCPGSLRYNRRYLDALTKHDQLRLRWNDAARTSFWLLRLSRTNRVDLERSVKAFNHYEMYGFTVDVFEGLKRDEIEGLELEYFTALFEVEELQRFEEKWRERSVDVSDDRYLALIQAALDALSGEPDVAARGLELIDETVATPAFESTGLRFRLLVARHQHDLPGFERTIARMSQIFRSTIQDHIAYWDLLVENGNRPQAIREAESFVMKPRTYRDVLDVGNAYYRIGLNDLAFRYMANYVTAYGFSSSAWLTQARILVQEKRWTDLNTLARSLRATEGVSESYVAFSYFLDVKAYHERGRNSDVDRSVKVMQRYSLKDRNLSLFVASNLWGLHQIDATMSVLWPQRALFRNDLVYWDLLLRAATQLGQGGPAIVAAENLYRIDPENQTHRANYAAILMSERIQVDRALALTYDALLRNPLRLALKVNYAQALVLNHRYEDADDILQEIDLERLTREVLEAYKFVRMDLHYQRQEFEEALLLAREMEPGRLLPGDRARLKGILNGGFPDAPEPSKSDKGIEVSR